MCAKFNQVISRLIPEGSTKEALKGAYYSLYYNKKHFKENGFRVYRRLGHFEYDFDEGVRFSSHENMADELKRSLKGYLAKYSLKKGDVVIDGGAYIGEFTLYAAKAVGIAGKVIAFEPDEKMYKKLLANIELNALGNVVAINKGLWSSDGKLKFMGDSVKGYTFMMDSDAKDVVEVPVVSLDNELARMGIKKVDFIKADVEGAELEVIKGALDILKGQRVNLAIASYHMLDGKKTFDRIEDALRPIGYNVDTDHPGHLTTYAFKA